MFTQEEIQSWENETAFAQRHNKKFIDPRKEKLKDHRKESRARITTKKVNPIVNMIIVCIEPK